MPKKIIILIDGFNAGGAEKHAASIGCHLQKSGKYDVAVFSITDNSKSGVLTGMLTNCGVSYGSIPYEFHYGHFRRGLELIRFANRLRKLKPDIIMSYTIRPNIAAGAVWNITGAKGFIWNQVDRGFGFTENHRDKILVWAMKNTPLFISNSENGLDSLLDYFPKAKNYRIIKWGVNLKTAMHDRSYWRNVLDIPIDSKIGIMVGNLTSFKDQITLVKAWSILHSTNGANTPYLVLAGYHGDTFGEIQKTVEQLGLDEFVKMPGSVQDITGLIQASDFCVFSSLSEGLPAGITECMAAGLPVVATNIDGNREALGKGYPYLVEPGSYSGFAKMIQVFLDNNQISSEVGRDNKIRIEREFSQTFSFNEYENAIELLLR